MNNLIALPGKGELSKPVPLKTVFPTWADLVRSLITVVQGQGC